MCVTSATEPLTSRPAASTHSRWGDLARLHVVVALAVAVGACSGPEDFAVPPTGPHEAYVARVVEALAATHAETLALLEEQGAVSEEVEARLAATFASGEAGRRADGLRNVLAGDLEGFPGAEGAPSRRFRDLLDADETCVLVEVEVAFPAGGLPASAGQRAVESGPDGARRPVVVELRRAEVDEAVNPTGWVIAREELVTGPAAARGCG